MFLITISGLADHKLSEKELKKQREHRFEYTPEDQHCDSAV